MQGCDARASRGFHHMQQFSNQEMAELRSSLDHIHALLASRGDDEVLVRSVPDTIELGPVPAAALSAPVSVGDANLVDQVAFNIQMRRMRKSHFDGAQLSGAIWDMLLDLTLALTHGRDLSASDLATGAAVPLSSGLRMIAALEQHGLAERSIDAKDRRRSIVRLTDRGTERMAAYFEKISLAWANRHRRAM